MDEPQGQETGVREFERFKDTMRQLMKVSKANLDARLKHHAETTHKKRPGPKPKAPSINS